jgi:hypothetical protein
MLNILCKKICINTGIFAVFFTAILRHSALHSARKLQIKVADKCGAVYSSRMPSDEKSEPDKLLPAEAALLKSIAKKYYDAGTVSEIATILNYSVRSVGLVLAGDPMSSIFCDRLKEKFGFQFDNGHWAHKPNAADRFVIREPRKGDDLRVGVFGWAPMLGLDDSRKLITGWYGILLDVVSERTEVNFVPVEMRLNDCTAVFEKDEPIDIVPGIFELPERLSKTEVTAFLHIVGVGGIVSKKSSNVKELHDLHDPSIKIVVTDNNTETMLNRFQVGHESRVEALKILNLADAVSHVFQPGRRVVLADRVTLENFLATHTESGLKRFPQDPTICSYFCGTLIRREQAGLKKWLNREFLAATSDERVRKAHKVVDEMPDSAIRRLFP